MTSSPSTPFLPTPLQFAFLSMLLEKPLTGTQMRGELAEAGVLGSKEAFFGVIQRLKKEELVTAERIARDEGVGSLSGAK